MCFVLFFSEVRSGSSPKSLPYLGQRHFIVPPKMIPSIPLECHLESVKTSCKVKTNGSYFTER